MQQLVTFFIKYKNFVLFVLLLGVSLLYFVRSHYLHETRFANSTNWITGTIYDQFNIMSTYFSLRKDNALLLEENKRLRKKIFDERSNDTNDNFFLENYELTTAQIIKNSYSKAKNYLTINKGRIHGISEDMGIITSKGIIGIVEDTSEHFALVQSILNSYSQINAKIQRTRHFGTLKWNATAYDVAQLVDIPRLAEIKQGDTIVTGGMSAIFPEGIPIGTIKDFQLDDSKNYFSINVALFNDMTSTTYVYVIKNKQKQEQILLDETIEDE